MKPIIFAVTIACSLLTIAPAGCQGRNLETGQRSAGSTGPVLTPARDEPAELAAKMRAYLAGLDELTVDSRQRVSYLKFDELTPEELAAPEKNAVRAMQMHPDKVVSVDVRIHAEMTPDSFVVTVWRGDEERPIAINSLALRDGVPYVTEREWHPILGDYREVSYPSPHAFGYDDAAVQSVLFEEIDSRVCATAEFFRTWLGDSDEADSFERIISDAVVVHATPAMASAGSTRLHREIYKDEEETGFSSGDQYFVLSSEPALLLQWDTELVALKYDKSVFAYMTVERTYAYPTAFSGSEQ